MRSHNIRVMGKLFQKADGERWLARWDQRAKPSDPGAAGVQAAARNRRKEGSRVIIRLPGKFPGVNYTQ
jgi:hypothetical protein